MGKSLFPLYHWSPASRRMSILRYGLRPGFLSNCGAWRPPYVSFSDSPSLAWVLSGLYRKKGEEWDLWMMWSNVPSGYEKLKTGDNPRGAGWPSEYRVYERVPKKSIWYVASRKQPTPHGKDTSD